VTAKPDIGWSEANQAHLARSLAALKALLRGEAGHPPAADAPAFAARPPALARLSKAFSLSPFESNLLLLCAGVELDADLAGQCAALQTDTRPFPTFSLALSRLPEAHWSALDPQAPLRRWRLIELAEGQPLTTAALRIDETVLHFLVGLARLDRRLAATLLPLPMLGSDALAPSHTALAQQIAGTWEAAAAGTPPLIQLIGDTTDGRPITAAAGALIGLRAAVLTADRVPSAPAEMEEMVQIWSREVCLSGFGVLLVERDDDAGTPAIARLLERLPGPVVLCERERSRIGTRAVAGFEVAPPTETEQRDLWHATFSRVIAEHGAAIATASDLASRQFSLSRLTIEAIAAEAAARLGRGAPGPDLGDTVWDLCRTHARLRLDGLAQRIDAGRCWRDLVLPDAEMATLNGIAAQMRQRATVYGSWGFGADGARGLGITALFCGDSGTGKTLAAEVLASSLRLDLYRIDLASVVSKYIGETEKNLRRVFDAAERSGAILLFDEADALFGKRSEVKDSHDRYANIEVSYLLQRMEVYRGLAILTSNLKTALDPAFLRRLRFIVQFPFPDAAQRLRIWRQVFPAATPVQGLDFDRLALLRVAGGNIRSIALNAAFLAADAAQPVRMSHVMAAARSEYAKLERQLTAAEGGAWT
jgi:ATPase family associated with various cellular activities (AAA)/Winged helix domain, variant